MSSRVRGVATQVMIGMLITVGLAPGNNVCLISCQKLIITGRSSCHCGRKMADSLLLASRQMSANSRQMSFHWALYW